MRLIMGYKKKRKKKIEIRKWREKSDRRPGRVPTSCQLNKHRYQKSFDSSKTAYKIHFILD